MNWWEVIIDAIYRIFGYRRVTATSVLTTLGGSKVAGAPVTLSYSKAGGRFTNDGTGITNEMGVATEGVYLKKGEYSFMVTFSGNSSYGSSDAVTNATV